jgi:hypothetical protein
MKKLMTMLAVFAMAGLVFNACKDDDEDPTPLTLSTLMAGSSDLNAATSATDVGVDAAIVAEFSTEIDEATATDGNILLTRTYDGSAVDKTISVDGTKITITPDNDFYEGDNYKIKFTSGLKSTQGQAITEVERSFGIAGVGLGTAPKSSNQMLYVQFTNDIVDLTGNATKASAQVAYMNDRFGNANSAANFRGTGETPGTGDIVELSGDDFIDPSMTLSVWVYIDATKFAAPGNKPLLGLAAANGYFVEIGDWKTEDCECTTPNWLKVTTNHDVNPLNEDPTKQHDFATQWGDFGATDDETKVNTLTATGWHHLVMTFDAATYTKTDYWDGVKIKTYNTLDAANNEWNLKDMMLNDLEGVDPKLALGYFASKTNTNPDWAQYPTSVRTWEGGMDDLRLFDVALSASEVTTLYNAEKP